LTFTLSPDQETALLAVSRKLETSDEAILTGAAGTGKTTVLKAFLARQKQNIVSGTPTWRAALRYQEVVGRPAMTIHSIIYGKPEEEENKDGTTDLRFVLRGTGKGAISQRSLVVVDEASMVGVSVYRDLMAVVRRNLSSILWIGDKEQLSPPNDKWGVDLDHPTAALTQVHRQAQNSTPLRFLTAIREGKIEDFRDYDESCRWVPGKQDTIEKFILKTDPERFIEENVIITYTNDMRRGISRIARRLLGATAPIVVNDPLLSFSNRAGLVNGEFVRVVAIENAYKKDELWYELHRALSPFGIDIQAVWVKPPGRSEHRVFVFPQVLAASNGNVSYKTLMEPIFEKLTPFGLANEKSLLRGTSGDDLSRYPRSVLDLWTAAQLIADVEHGYASTAHKAQGSQWPNVLVLVEPTLRYVIKKDASQGVDFGRRWIYTAASRAQSTVQMAYMP
jgi:energy-coupling factor transporter ATP-binding protein EcfA2